MANKNNKKGTNKTTTNKKKPNNSTTKKTTTKKTTPIKKETKAVEKEKKTPIKEEEKIEVKEEVKEEIKTVEKKEVKKECNKKHIYIICAAIAVILLVVIIFMIKNNNKSRIEKSIKNMGKQFYTEYYYPQITKNKSKKEISNILSKFEKSGIKINLKNLSVYKGGTFKKEIDTFKNKDKECSKEKTKVIIRPSKPYGKNDYKIEVELNCGF